MTDHSQPPLALAPIATMQQAALAALRWELQGLSLMLPCQEPPSAQLAAARAAQDAAFEADHDNMPV